LSALSPNMVQQANDLMDKLFDQGEEATELLRKIDNNMANEIEIEYRRLHDEALSCHAELVAAAQKEEVAAFRRNFGFFVAKMQEFQRCITLAVAVIGKNMPR
jgi:hypothetical protein